MPSQASTTPAKFFLLLCLTMLGGCTAVERLQMTGLYVKTDVPQTQVARDIVYKPGSTSPKHRLDLFQPASKRWPVMVFIHGGGWHKGDKSLSYGGNDVYGNIGRFYASQGIGVAVISYRLQPHVTWREQVSDAADAVAWVKKNIASYGGDSSRIYLAGHSAGGYLASYVALNREVAAQHGVPPIAGVICVSGVGLDMCDPSCFELGNRLWLYARRFAEAGTRGDWARNASPATYVTRGAPPFLIMHAEGDFVSLRRQASHFHEVLDRAGVRNRLVVVPGESHAKIVLALSREDKTAGPAILDFIGVRRGGQ